MQKFIDILTRDIAIPLWLQSIFFALVFLFASYACFYHYIDTDRDVVKSTSDLQSITGQVASYSFTDGKFASYYLLLVGHYAKFQIAQENLRSYAFAKQQFIEDVHPGDEVTLAISKRAFQNDLGSYKYIQVFSVQKGREIFLHSEDAIKSYDTQVPVYIGTVSFLIAILLFLAAVKEFSTSH